MLKGIRSRGIDLSDLLSLLLLDRLLSLQAHLQASAETRKQITAWESREKEGKESQVAVEVIHVPCCN